MFAVVRYIVFRKSKIRLTGRREANDINCEIVLVQCREVFDLRLAKARDRWSSFWF